MNVGKVKPTKIEKKAEKPKNTVKVAKSEKKISPKSTTKPAKVEKKEIKADKVVSKKPVQEVAEQKDKPVKIVKKIQKSLAYNFKLFDKWDSNIQIVDLGLKRYITLSPKLIPFSQGRNVKKQFWKSDKHIVERLILKLMIPGHKGKKHFRSSGQNTGKYSRISKIVKDAFTIIENKTKTNPIEVYVRAIENGSPREGVTTIEYGGVRYPKAVDLAPQRRIDLVLRWICQGAFHAKSGKGKKANMSELLAQQIMLTADSDQKANAVKKKFETERSASSSR